MNLDPDPHQSLTNPISEAISIVLDPAVGEQPWRVARRRLTTALRVALGQDVKGWRVRRVPMTTDVAYDLLPPDGLVLTSQEAWELTYVLRTLPDILDAEPSFALLQDAYVAPVDPAHQPLTPAATFATAAEDPCADEAPPATIDPLLIDWAARLVDAPCAWRLEPQPAGQARGAGIRIGHPDSGYRYHSDLFAEPDGAPSRVRIDLQYDFVDRDRTAENDDGQHGLSTGSFIMSSDQTGRIVGIAPGAELVPLRVTAPRFGVIPAPILFDSGARALRDAIRYATYTTKCHVISISLGWFWNRSLHRAIREAEANNVILCAAAGNYTPFVIWPAAYPEVIAVGGCTAQRMPWAGSAAGRAVEVCAPSDEVWVPSFTQSGAEGARATRGTSFGTTTVAGVAALWLAYHGRDELLERYAGSFTLTEVFRYVLRVSSDPFPVSGGDGYGAGIVNARRALTTDLPSEQDLRAASIAALATPVPATPTALIASVFSDVDEMELQRWLAQKLDVAPSEVDERIAGFEEEVLFLIATDPDLRAELAPPDQSPGILGVAPSSTPAPQPALPAERLSQPLRRRLHGAEVTP